MTTTAFEFASYKDFVCAKIAAMPNNGRGVRRRLAQKIGCQVAYVSHVLAGEKNFSAEQAEACARFFRLRDDETEYFLLLLERERAGTAELKRLREKQLAEKRRAHSEIKGRIRIHNEITPEEQATYYSSWHYQAVRSLLTVPGFADALAIGERLQIAPEKVHEVLEFLLSRGLASETEQGLVASEKQIHLPRTSPLISKLHSNWRVRTLASLENIRAEDYHYSGIFSLSREDLQRVREILMKALEASIEVVRPSREETLCLLAMDLFEL